MEGNLRLDIMEARVTYCIALVTSTFLFKISNLQYTDDFHNNLILDNILLDNILSLLKHFLAVLGLLSLKGLQTTAQKMKFFIKDFLQ